MIKAAGLGLRTRQGWVFHDVDLSLPAGSVAAIAGPAGSGRSMLLLTLAGRARPTDGTLSVDDTDRRAAIRRRVAVARVTGAIEPDPDLLVADCRREAVLLSPGAEVAWAEGLVGLTADGATPVGDLAADDDALLAVALAVASRPTALVLDDVDRNATHAQQARVWAALAAVAAEGITTITSTVDPVHAGDAVVHHLGEESRATD
jgi:ABC-2 type transport system ATP-binding protein